MDISTTKHFLHYCIDVLKIQALKYRSFMTLKSYSWIVSKALARYFYPFLLLQILGNTGHVGYFTFLKCDNDVQQAFCLWTTVNNWCGCKRKNDCCHFLGWLLTGRCLYSPLLKDPSATTAGVKIYSFANKCSFPTVLLFIYFCMLYVLITMEKPQCQMILGIRNRTCNIFLFFMYHFPWHFLFILRKTFVLLKYILLWRFLL